MCKKNIQGSNSTLVKIITQAKNENIFPLCLNLCFSTLEPWNTINKLWIQNSDTTLFCPVQHFFESKLISTVAVSNGQFSQGIETKGGASCHGRRSVRLSRQAFGTV